MKKVVNTKNKTGPGRSPFELHLPLIREMLDSGAALWEITDALSKLGVERAPNTLSEWLKRRKQGYRRPSFGYLAPPSPSPISRSPQIKTLKPSTVSFSLHTTPNAPVSVPQTTSEFQMSPADLAALKAKAEKSAKELSNRIPQ